MNSNQFRDELLKTMPGYNWTVHRSRVAGRLAATGTQSSGSNRLSTLAVVRTEREGQKATYNVKSAGNGTHALWAHECMDGTLARALRGLQDYYEACAETNRRLAGALARGRKVADRDEGVPA